MLNIQNVAATLVKRGRRGLPWAASLMATLGTAVAQTPALTQSMPSAFQNAAPDGQSRHSETSQFSGAWRNYSPNAGSVTRLEVEDRGKRLRVHAWGACSPRECDWGIAEGRSVAEPPTSCGSRASCSAR